ncbi:hypothetical protein ADK52_11145, partial [Streptomyces sp. WM6372]
RTTTPTTVTRPREARGVRRGGAPSEGDSGRRGGVWPGPPTPPYPLPPAPPPTAAGAGAAPRPSPAPAPRSPPRGAPPPAAPHAPRAAWSRWSAWWSS